MTSTIKVNNIQNQCGANIINENSNTITIGASGDTIALASGASQTGFGREGSVDWQTGSIKTGNFTAASGEGYFINSSGSITMNLPAGSAGAIVAVSDYARNFATHNFIITPNGSEKIGGTASSATLDVNGQAATFVYVDSTKGWINVQNAEDTETGAISFMAATGGTVSTCGDFKVHKFTGPGTFCVSQVSTVCSGRNSLFYAVVAGGGGGGDDGAGGGGAGGFRLGGPGPFPSTPLAAPALTATVTAFPITVGGGGAGAGSPNTGVSGSNSIFSTITSAGGGGGGSRGETPKNGVAGGSGGGGGGSSPASPGAGCFGAGGSGNTPSVSPAQGNSGGGGGASPAHQGGGGGGATGGGGSVGGNPGSSSGGPGGAGGSITELFGASPKPFYGPTNGVLAGGGGGSGRASPGPAPGGAAGPGGGGQGEGQSMSLQSGTVNTGGGGGGSEFLGTTAGSGGSGIVYIKYKFQ